MLGNRSRPRIPLPKQWSKLVRSGVLHAISLAHFSLTFTRSWAANGFNARIRLKAENDRLRQELALLQGKEKLLQDNHRIAFKYNLAGGYRISDGYEPLGLVNFYDTFGPELSFAHTLQKELPDTRIAIAKMVSTLPAPRTNTRRLTSARMRIGAHSISCTIIHSRHPLFGHLVTRSPGHPVTWSPGHLVTWRGVELPREQ